MADKSLQLVVAFAGMLVFVGVFYLIYSSLTSPGFPSAYTCLDGRNVSSVSECPEFQKFICPDGALVSNESDCPPECTQETIEALLRSKSNPTDGRISSAARSAFTAFNESTDNESQFFRMQLGANVGDGSISADEAAEFQTAVALFRFVRDMPLSGSPPDIRVTRDDTAILASGTARADEKALLLHSLYISSGLSSRVISIGDPNCRSSPCECMMQPRSVMVAVKIRGFQGLQIYENDLYNGSLTSCAMSDGSIVVNPSCGNCTFAFGYNCRGIQFRTLLSD